MPNPANLDPSASVLAYYGAELRRHREAADMSQKELGEAVFCSPALVGLIECAKRLPTREFTEHADKAVEANGALVRLWPLVSRHAFPPWFRGYVELEAAAAGIRTYQLQVVHGLLQTEDYARAVLGTGRHSDLEAKVSARMERQRVLERDDAPRIWMILDEAALRRPAAGAEVMRVQLERLLSYRRAPRVVVQVLPFSAGVAASPDGSYNILTMEQGDEVVYSEGMGGSHVMTHPSDVEQVVFHYDLLRAAAMSPDDSAELIASLMEEA
jgi:transcriptional regulator with XRE-family HTH domain